ncbi:MAG: transposase [Alkaliphilus sp.]
MPKKEKLAHYLMKYVGSPPIALSRIIEYDGRKVKYWYKDHRTHKKEVAEVDVLTFIGRMVQHILPNGFKTVRYYSLHATCKAKKVAVKLIEFLRV